MRQRHRSAMLTVLCIVAAECGKGTTEPVLVEKDQRLALAVAQGRWAAANIHDYAFDMGTWGSWFVDSLHIEVRNDVVVSTVSLKTGQTGPFGVTVPQMFDAIQRGFANGSAVDVSYHLNTGYPVRINLPNPPNWADADWAATISNFRTR